MKKEERDILAEKIKEKNKLPQKVKEETNQIVFKNVVLGIIIILYFIFINLAYFNIVKDVLILDIKVFSICLIIITIWLFEKAYTKANSELAINGIEILFVALVTLFMQYVYFYKDTTFIKIYMLIPVMVAIYYVIKATVIVVKTQNKYRNNISDVKEIIKKEKKTIIEEPTEDKDNVTEKRTTTKKTKKEIEPKQTKNTAKKKTTKTKEPAENKTTPKTTSNKKTTNKTTSKKSTASKKEIKNVEKKTTTKSAKINKMGDNKK